MTLYLLLLYFTTELVTGYSQNYFENHKYCEDLSPYFGEINLDLVAGTWYGVEKIHHSKGEYRIEHSRECFYIDIKELNIQPTPPPPYGSPDSYLSSYNYNYNNNPSYMLTTPYTNRPFGTQEPYRVRHFELQWHEGIWKDEYHIKVNTSHKGFWPTDVPYGSVDKMYRFFGGVIQVLKMGHNHLVLNFCMRLPHSQFYSVILSRHEHQLTAEDLASIHNIFTLKHLSTSSLKRVCDNSADTAKISNLMALIVGFLLWRSRW